MQPRSDSSDEVAAEHPEEGGEEPQHSNSERVASEVGAGEDQGGLLERQRSERVGVLTELVVATAGEVLRVRRETPPGKGRTVGLADTSVYSIGRCMNTPP